jgi:tRNA (guanine-N7-)-methyltransferase
MTDTAPPISTSVPRRDIKSFVRRTGRTTTGQAKALHDLGPQFILPYTPPDTPDAINSIAAHAHKIWEKHDISLQNPPKLVLEIGFGMGEATAHIAKVMPDVNFVCCEVHPPGVGALLKRIAENNITNIRIVQHDAVEVLRHMLAEHALDGVHIFFPDPWHKKRHHKRRLIQPPLVQLLASRLKTGGYIHCATDWQPYAEQILQVLQGEQALRNTAFTQDGYAPKPPYRPLTKFENRGIKLGHGVWDVVFAKI